ncbi:hypothetical protein PTTG_00317 [Puccinia triticina 1-1 BBBD Race 1]|uniref:Ferric oxidoreductase domain-containing protein n=1 Tax=Puccinia triticina (isolate 1-1 / race 1 (BBBD)) TaxID=630390 RepID=A0A180GZI9_PUCT1|nr:hypothetical protein PTTG_00317 [Puccinia triticina 1-1 BBBD Race 1]
MEGNYGRDASQMHNQNAPLSPLIGGQGYAAPLSPMGTKFPGYGYPGHEKERHPATQVYEKGIILAPKPAPNPPPLDINKSVKFWTWFSPYRQMLVLVVVVEALMIIVTLLGGWHFARTHLPALVTGNLLVAIAIRSEWVMRLLYWISIKLFRRWTPLKFRVLVVAILYHIGGLHSGCGISAMMWLLLSWTYHIMNKDLYNPLVMASLFVSMVVVVVTCFVATPIVRAIHHNIFEITHRFLGWLGIITSLIFVIVSSWWDINTQTWRTSGKYLVRQEEFWFMIAIIPLIIGQWITVRHVPVTVNAPSGKASVIRVPGGLTSGLHTRVSRDGLREWHIFGSIRLFNRGVAICTGSGIGAVGSTCIQHDDWFLIWIGADLEKTYGTEFINFIKSKIQPERLLIWDTKGPLGRPDVNVELEKVYKQWNAQVALFIGSPALNKSVLRTSRARGIPVFGSIWDA